jgi:hypothetical protein
MVRQTLAHIDKKRAALGLPAYQPDRFGRSGDARLLQLEAAMADTLPLAARREALYGNGGVPG